MNQEKLNQKEFSQKTGISPATLSSIFNGRTSPTLNHAELLHKSFPDLNMSWLIFGEGEMFLRKGSDSSVNGQVGGNLNNDLFSSPYSSNSDGAQGAQGGDDKEMVYNYPSELGGDGHPIPVVREIVKYVDKPQRKITEVRIFFDDGTYAVFPGSQ